MNTDAPTDVGARINRSIKRLPRSIRGHIVAMLGELIGTTSFIFFAFAGTQTANVASNVNTGTTVITTTVQKNPAQLLYISLSFGFSLAVNAWIFFRVSGGLFNPAVTLGMVLIGAITIVRGILLFLMQMAGAIAGAYMVDALFTGGLNVNTTLATTTTVAQGVVIEMLLTMLLCFTIFMLAAEKHVGNFIAPVGIGLALFISELVGVFWTGGSLNPARSFAPAVVSGFEKTHWIYWVGPVAGSILAVIIYKIIKALEYETANPDPESASPTGPTPGPVDYSNAENRTDVERAESKEYSDKDTTSSSLTRNGNTARVHDPMPKAVPTGNPVAMLHRGYDPNSQMPPPAPAPIAPIPAPPTTTTTTTTHQNYQRSAPEYPQIANTIPQNAPLNYSAQRGQGGNVDDSQWNAVHSANARSNTVKL